MKGLRITYKGFMVRMRIAQCRTKGWVYGDLANFKQFVFLNMFIGLVNGLINMLII